MTAPAVATTAANNPPRVPTITRARDTSSLKSFLAGASGHGKTHLASTFPNCFMLAIEEGLKGCSPDHDPDHFEEVDLPQSMTDLYRLIDIFVAENAKRTTKWRHLVLDSLTGIQALANAAAMVHHRVKDMEGKEYKVVWETATQIQVELQQRLDRVRRTGVNVWIISHAEETIEAVSETGATYRRWDIQLRGPEKIIRELKLLWRGWADQVLMLAWAATVEKNGKGHRAVGKLRGRVLYTRETGTHYAKTRLKLPPVIPATWEDFARAVRAGVPAPEPKLRAELEALLPQLGEYREEVTAALSAAKGANALAALLSRAQGILATLDDGDDQGEEPPPAAPVAEPPADEPPPPGATAPAPSPASPPSSPAPAPAPPIITEASAPAPAPAPPADDEARGRAIVNDATDRQSIAKAFVALNPLKLSPDVRKELRDQLLAKRDGLPLELKS